MTNDPLEHMTDDELAALSREVGALPRRVRDPIREQIAFRRTLLEITGCRTAVEAIAQVRTWKERENQNAGNSSDNYD